MEREAAGGAEPAAGHPAPLRAQRSGRVLEQHHLRRDRALQLLPVERPPEEVDREHGPGPRRDGVVDLGEIEVERGGVDVDENGGRPGEPHDVRGGRERVGRHDHLVSLADPERQHREMERGGAVGDGDGVLDAARLGDELLELLHLRPHRQRARRQDGTHLRELGLAELREG
jgi:hypothetical protein